MEELHSTNTVSDFTQSEIVKLENLFEEVGEKSRSQEFCQKLASSFSSSVRRAGKPNVTWEQVHSWFQNRQKELQADFSSSPSVPKGRAVIQKHSVSNNAPESSQTSKGGKASELSELAFEARSSKDYAWYDVGSFLNYRVLHTGELEARVRFAGFSNTDDEWVNVRRDIRERSIPLEPSECERVKVGDLILCFRERNDLAIYCDAYVVEVHRRLHDIKGCRCLFVVRYEYDYAEETVSWKRICCRPS